MDKKPVAGTVMAQSTAQPQPAAASLTSLPSFLFQVEVLAIPVVWVCTFLGMWTSFCFQEKQGI